MIVNGMFGVLKIGLIVLIDDLEENYNYMSF